MNGARASVSAPTVATAGLGQFGVYARAARMLEPARALALPLVFAAALALLALLPTVFEQPVVRASFWGAAGLLVAWATALLVVRQRQQRSLALEIVLRPQHYLQACVHSSILLYWGWYWREVYHAAPLILAQLLFAFGFDMLLGWSRRQTYTFGFGPFPIVFSTNLFLWFRPDWFYLQFLMLAVGFLAKDLIRWEKDGRRVHIFNPSSFTLGLFSLVLILTGQTAITWGAEIASTFEWPPHIRLWIFLVALPGQFLFGVTRMTMFAVLSVCGFGLLYYWAFGTYYFIDGFIPAAVFLGMHLLFTDPSTSPQTELGRILFGIMYGLGVVALFGLLGQWGAPTFYDKLLAVPLMNLTIQVIDSAARSRALRWLDPSRLGRSLTTPQRNLVWMSIWAVVFVIISDPTDAYRPRRWVPFWEQACTDGRRDGCQMLGTIETRYCNQGSGWACNDLGILLASGRATGRSAPQAFAQACQLGVRAGCTNFSIAGAARGPGVAEAYQRSQPQPADYRVLLQEGQGPLDQLSAAQLYEQACHQQWGDGCNRLAGVYFLGAPGAARDVPRALRALERGCDLQFFSSCADLGVIYERGDGVLADPAKGRGYLERACDGGFSRACERLEGRGQVHSGG